MTGATLARPPVRHQEDTLMLDQSPTFGDLRLPARFWAKVRVLPNGCWEWMGACRGGYGRFHVGNRNALAHRVAYEALVGPMPDGLQPDHLCRNRPCVNTAHLEPVTNAVNCRRGSRAKLTEIDVRMIRELRGIISQRKLAQAYGVVYGNIGFIQRGESWIFPTPGG